MTVVQRADPRAGAPASAANAPSRRLWAHLAGLAVILVALLPLMTPRGAFTSDEGAYALQARALARGSWAYDYRAAPLDPTGESFPIILSDQHGTSFFTYIKHPVYPLLLRAAERAAGETVGLHLWPLLGVLGTAAAAWLLAKEVDPRLRVAAFWLAATGPVLVNGYMAWAHSLSAAVAGFTLLAAVRIFKRGPNAARLGALAAGTTAGVLLRSEGLLFAGAVGAALALAAWWRPADARRWSVRTLGHTALLFLGAAGPALVAALAERRWVHAISDGAYENLQSRSGSGGGYIGGRLSGAWRDLLGGPALTVVAMAILVWFGVVAMRRSRSAAVVGLGIGAAGAVVFQAVQVALHPGDPVLGLFAAWPLVLLGLLLAPWRSLRPPVRFLGGASALFGLAVIATEYGDGGGLEWGGRFFFPLLAPLAVLAVAGIDARLSATNIPRMQVGGLLGAVAASTAVVSLVAVGSARADKQHVVDAVARHPAALTLTTVIALPRIAWSLDDRVTWMLTDPERLAQVLDDLRGRGVTELNLVTGRVDRATLGLYHVVEQPREPALAAHGMSLLRLST